MCGCVCVSMYGLCNMWVCVCVGFIMCGWVYEMGALSLVSLVRSKEEIFE